MDRVPCRLHALSPYSARRSRSRPRVAVRRAALCRVPGTGTSPSACPIDSRSRREGAEKRLPRSRQAIGAHQIFLGGDTEGYDHRTACRRGCEGLHSLHLASLQTRWASHLEIFHAEYRDAWVRSSRNAMALNHISGVAQLCLGRKS